MIARMDAVLADLAARPPSRVRTVAAWSGGGAVPGRGSLADAVIVAAGAVNIAARTDDARYGDFDVEALLRARPDALLQGDPRLTLPALRVEQGRHPLVRRLYAGRTIATPESLYACGLPQTADAALALRRALDGLAP
jgi:iron complex transport system substrate-binding protein